jgi:hypothetical protein
MHFLEINNLGSASVSLPGAARLTDSELAKHSVGSVVLAAGNICSASEFRCDG